MQEPIVSVVMSVYNGGDALRDTLGSILSQKGVPLEFIVVNDGSSDTSPLMLDEWAARDPRLRVIHQTNTGLTRALIRGCSEARGNFIARQDCGDLSLPGRLAQQVDRLTNGNDFVAVSCHTQFIGPRDEPLFCTEIDEAHLNQGLRYGLDGHHKGPSHHGSVMMRRDAYVRAGGYRAAFHFAQDLDLWTRLAQLGQFAVVPKALYKARLDARSISGMQALEQRRLAELIAAATRARNAGRSEVEFLAEASTVRPVAHGDRARRLAQGNYFIGSCIAARDPVAAQKYFKSALSLNPTMARAWIKLLLCFGRAIVAGRNA